LARAKSAGVEKILAVGGSPELNGAALEAARIAAGAPDLPGVLVACGYDRDQACRERPALGDDLPLAAWGEIGLDYHSSPDTRAAQLALFEGQLEEARRRGLPVSIHTREADDDTLAVLRQAGVGGVIHCFTGDPGFCRRLLDLGFFISFSGIVTFRAADNVRESALVVPDDRLLVETDSPFLAPVPMRGGANEPAYVVHTARFLARLRGRDEESFAELVFANAEGLFASSSGR
jgi:TatD DNase family protein